MTIRLEAMNNAEKTAFHSDIHCTGIDFVYGVYRNWSGDRHTRPIQLCQRDIPSFLDWQKQYIIKTCPLLDSISAIKQIFSLWQKNCGFVVLIFTSPISRKKGEHNI